MIILKIVPAMSVTKRIYEEKDNSEDFTVVLNSSSQGSDLAYYILRPFEITKIS